MTAEPIRVRCPAKINWTLRILGKRPDGFHELVTVLQAIDLWDDLVLSPSATLELTCSRPGIPCGTDNLVIRAL